MLPGKLRPGLPHCPPHTTLGGKKNLQGERLLRRAYRRCAAVLPHNTSNRLRRSATFRWVIAFTLPLDVTRISYTASVRCTLCRFIRARCVAAVLRRSLAIPFIARDPVSCVTYYRYHPPCCLHTGHRHGRWRLPRYAPLPLPICRCTLL